MAEATFWSFQPCEARRVRVIVGDDGFFPRYWARAQGLVGRERAAVEVKYGNDVVGVATFYLDNADGSGWRKVTEGLGGPGVPHRELQVERVLEPA